MKIRIEWLFVAAALGLGMVAVMLLATNALSGEVQAQTQDPSLVDFAQSTANWVSETVDSEGDAGHSSSLALAGAGTPHIAYIVETSDSLKYAVLSGTTWISETIEVPAASSSLVLDNSGSPHIAYTRRHPTVNYTVLSGTIWVTETVDGEMVAGPSLALDSLGNPHMAYGDVRPVPPHGPGAGFKYAYWTGSQWVIGIVEEVEWDGVPSLALGNSGTPHIAYNAASDDSLRYAILSGTTWIRETVEVSAVYPSLVLDGSGNSHIAYTHRGPYVNYAVLRDDTWAIEMVDSEMVAGPSLALDSFGNPHMAYCDVRPTPPNGPGMGLKYAYRTSDGWIVEVVDPVQCEEPSLALDSLGNPHISYYDVENGDLKYVQWVPVQSTATITTGGGDLYSSGDQTAYSFPQDTFTDTVVITHTLHFAGSVPPSENLTSIGHAFDVTAVYSSTGTSAQPAPGQTYTVTVQYTDEERGLVAESTLALYYWDGNQWVKEPSSEVDTAANTVTATPNHFSLWAVLGETWRVYLPVVLRHY